MRPCRGLETSYSVRQSNRKDGGPEMSSRGKKEHEAPSPPDIDLVGGTTALNFINTLRADAGSPLETLHRDNDVRAWMKKMGIGEPSCKEPLPEGTLLQSARVLRGLALSVVERKKAGKRVGLTALNHYLSQSRSRLKLCRRKDSIEVHREYLAESAEQFLAPIAEKIADLLSDADFDLIRRCEGAGCVLWFSDRTNGRPRRFCMEESCGTRTRVAAFRAKLAQRKQAAVEHGR